MEGEAKYGSVVVYDQDGVQRSYAEDMPFFVLLGQDLLVPGTIEDYSRRADAAADDFDRDGDHERAENLRALATSARGLALRTRGWQLDHPDEAKFPD